MKRLTLIIITIIFLSSGCATLDTDDTDPHLRGKTIGTDDLSGHTPSSSGVTGVIVSNPGGGTQVSETKGSF